MPSYLDFDTTKNFRDYILGKTLQSPNGPQTFSSSNYAVQSLSNMSNVDPGTVENNLPQYLVNTQQQNRTYWAPMQENSSLKLPQMSN
jgi:hypothetical protein